MMTITSAIMKRHHRKIYYVFALAVILIIVLVSANFVFQDPFLYSNTLTVQVVTDKSFYLQGEEVSISAYVTNGKDESFVQPTTINYSVLNPTGQAIYSIHLNPNFPNPQPTFPAHSKTLFSSHVWNQKNLNYKLVESGNYTIKVSIKYGTSECNIQIAE